MGYKKKWTCFSCGAFCSYYVRVHVRVDPWEPKAGSFGISLYACKEHIVDAMIPALKVGTKDIP